VYKYYKFNIQLFIIFLLQIFIVVKKFLNMLFLVELNILLLQSNFISTVSGYIDPASGTLALQMIAATIIGFGIAIKIYWYKLKERFTRSK
jgi:hypothetical protein|tara:strand:+ start:313 stop:585 length:273 start_codon:yes stop_codon:yes gene_type:complete